MKPKIFDSLKILSKISKECATVEYSLEAILFFPIDPRSTQKKFDSIDIQLVEHDGIQVNLQQFPNENLYFNKQSFLELCELKSFDSDIGILQFQAEDYMYFDFEKGETWIGNEKNENKLFLNNAKYYWLLQKEFIESNIAAYHSDARNECLITSSEEGLLEIGYDNRVPDIGEEQNLQESYYTFKAFGEKLEHSPELQQFFKGQLFSFLINHDREERFIYFCYKIKNIIEASKRDYEIFLNRNSFKKLKDVFRKERDEYFSSIRDVLDKILSKVVSIPVSISATALALYTLKSVPNFASIVVFAYIIYSLFTTYLLRALLLDTLRIRAEFGADLELVWTDFSRSKEMLDKESQGVKEKIRHTISTIVVLVILLMLFVTLILFGYFTILELPIDRLCGPAAIIIVLHILIMIIGVQRSLSVPNKYIWWISIILGVLGILGKIAFIPVVSAIAFQFVVVGFVLLALGASFRNL